MASIGFPTRLIPVADPGGSPSLRGGSRPVPRRRSEVWKREEVERRGFVWNGNSSNPSSHERPGMAFWKIMEDVILGLPLECYSCTICLASSIE